MCDHRFIPSGKWDLGGPMALGIDAAKAQYPGKEIEICVLCQGFRVMPSHLKLLGRNKMMNQSQGVEK